MGNYTILGGSENPRRGGQARNLTTNVPKILDLKSSSDQIFYENCRWVPLIQGKKLTYSKLQFPSENLAAQIDAECLIGNWSFLF